MSQVSSFSWLWHTFSRVPELVLLSVLKNPSANLMNSMVVKGRRRDTAWYSVIHDEWNGGSKRALEKWLSKENFDGQGKQVRKLEEIREGLGS